MIKGIDLKVYEGEKVVLKSIYNKEYKGICTEIDKDNGFVSIKGITTQEVTFAIEEVENISMYEETLCFDEHLSNKLKWGYKILHKWIEHHIIDGDYNCYLVGISE